MAVGKAPLVAIRDLSVTARTPLGPAHILRNVSLDIGRGRIVGVVGESGSGKSTLASCLLRLLPANVDRVSGAIDFDGADLLKLSANEVAAMRGTRMAMIFQDPMTALNPLFTIGTHLVDIQRRRRPKVTRADALRAAEAMLASVGIGDAHQRLKAYPHQLSGGMRQRVMIAMALLMEPDLLVADEPTTALDATVEAQIVALLQDLKTRFSGTVLFISHHLGLVAELCDDLIVMYGGMVVETGPVGHVLAGPHHPYTRALLACEIDDDHDGRLVAIPGDVPSPRQTLSSCVFAPRCGMATDACRVAIPPLIETDEGRRAACIRSRELRS
jgi:peptide/nickel transport system ATP-binding protein